MELVYLWVEDYKNIKNQGFNFSQRFRCDYKPDTNELTIEENDDYIENFFGENINVTAIVGKNGSGKSSVLEILNNLDCSPKYRYVFLKNNTFYICFDKPKIIIDNYSKYSFDILWYVEENVYEENSISSSLLSFLDDTEPLKSKEYIIGKVLEKDGICFDFINENFTFKYWQIKINKNFPDFKINSKETYTNLEDKFNFIARFNSGGEIGFLEIFTYVAIKLIMYILTPSKSIDETKYSELLQNLNDDFNENNYLELVNSIDLERFEGIGNYNLILDTLKDYQESVKYIEKFIEKREIKSNEIQEFINSGVYITLNSFTNNNFKYKFIEIDYLTNKDLKFLDLSSGEKERISNIALLIDDISETEGYELSIPMIDEPDIFLHPNWQKKIINDFVYILKKYKNNKFHLVLTTHSPFLLSDIPKQNIIFLDTDENGNCKVVDGLKEKKDTFGANIHTLLSDSFFMEDGLMGEFAKGNINEIIEFHNIVSKGRHKKFLKKIYEKRKKRFLQTQSVIGEEYLKQVIKNHLVEIEKILLGKDKAKEEEIKRVEKYLESLKND